MLVSWFLGAKSGEATIRGGKVQECEGGVDKGREYQFGGGV